MSLQWSSLLGGLGLFLWGMHMLSQGLRLAAGAALETVLARATGTRWRGLLSGAVTTAVVQSSSAVTVATIGFVNASLLTLGSAVWVLFGANLGTTATGWIVAFAGLKLDFSLLALPLIAAGAAFRLIGGKRGLAAWGEALAGFGMLFYGIVLMQSGFADLSAQWQIPQAAGVPGMALQTLAGLAMTVVMQSSSASIAIALTAAQSGLIDITGAAAVVIGANVGTTVTAVLASIGATPNAKRVAAAHVLFNVLTAVAAFVVLPWLVPGIVSTLAWIGHTESAVTTLAIFNTLFNVLGILLIWPMTGWLTVWLQTRFVADVSQGAKPQFLDQTTLPLPGLAVRALGSELARVLLLARQCVRLTLSPQADSPHKAEPLRLDLKRLLQASETFVDQMNRVEIDEITAQKLADLLRVRRYLDNVLEGEREIEGLPDELASLTGQANPALYAAYQQYLSVFSQVLGDRESAETRTQAEQAFEQGYQSLKAALLKAGAAGSYRLERMETALQRASTQRRTLQQLLKAEHWLAQTRADVDSDIESDADTDTDSNSDTESDNLA